MKRFVPFLLLLSVLLGASALPAPADENTDATAVAFAFVKAFNAGDAKGIAALAAPGDQAIIDDFGPHFWEGRSALVDWYAAFGADTKKQNITEVQATLSASPFTIVTGTRAWAPLPMEYHYKLKGVPQHEVGTLTFALEKGAAGWRILGWTWARTK